MLAEHEKRSVYEWKELTQRYANTEPQHILPDLIENKQDLSALQIGSSASNSDMTISSEVVSKKRKM